MDNIDKLKNIIEALLIVSESGLTRKEMKEAIPDVELKEINKAIEMLKEDYAGETRAFNIAEIAGKCRIVTKPEYMPWIGNLYQKETERLSGPGLETLAIIAYKQPVTRAEVEAIRGVNVGGTMKTLVEKGLLDIRGRKEVIGRPLLYGTSQKFLEIFGLNSLDDLPALKEFVAEDLEYGKPQEVVENTEEQSTDDGQQTTEEQAESKEQSAESMEAPLTEEPQGTSEQELQGSGTDEEGIEQSAEGIEEQPVEERTTDDDPQVKS